jgi:hypothetical protein
VRREIEEDIWQRAIGRRGRKRDMMGLLLARD